MAAAKKAKQIKTNGGGASPLKRYGEENLFKPEDLPSLSVLESEGESGTERRQIDARLDLVPDEPGVYLMKDRAGKVIYVGKARRLRRRLSSYFKKNPTGGSKVLAMIERIADFSFLVCRSELEALILESNLIKRYQPFYNILLKDDRDYPYMRITMNELYPRIEKAYRVGADQKKGCRYYGPYLNGDLNAALRSIHELFPLKTCRRVFPRDIGKERPCIQYHIGRCIGPCRGDVSAEDYREICRRVCSFLEGRRALLLEELTAQMWAEAERLDFKAAAQSRDRLRSLEKLFERQAAVQLKEEDADVLALAENDIEACVLKLELRGGKISGTSTYFFAQDGEGIDSDLDLAEELSGRRAVRGEERGAALMEAFLTQYYPYAAEIPPRILVDRPLAGAALLQDFLRELRGKKAELLFPRRGEKKELCAMASKNAKQTLERRSFLAGKVKRDPRGDLLLLQKALGMKRLPERIEAYDIANLGDQAIVCGMVVFEQGRLVRQAGRRFRLRSLCGQNDYAALREALERRLEHLEAGDLRFGARPDLILLDGGRGHLHEILRLFEEKGIRNLSLAAMIKDERHRTRGLVREDGSILELAELAGLRLSSGRAKKESVSSGGEAHGFRPDLEKGRRETLETEKPALPSERDAWEALLHKIQQRKNGSRKCSAATEVESEAERAAAEKEAKESNAAKPASELCTPAGELGDEVLRKTKKEREDSLQLLRFLTSIQNEVHRSANHYHRQLRSKKSLRFTLEEIAGIGEARRKRLMKAFGSIKAIAEASAKEIQERCPGIGAAQAERIFTHFHPDKEPCSELEASVSRSDENRQDSREAEFGAEAFSEEKEGRQIRQ